MASNEIEILDPTATVEKLEKIASGRALDRRHFMAALGMTGAAAGAGMLSGCSTSSTTSASTSASLQQSDYLNFALNLEYLEATFYSFIVKGTDLSSSLTVGSGAITNAPGLLTFAGTTTATGTSNAQITDLLNEIYYDEVNHVTTLRNLLGSIAVPRPAINLAALGTINATNAIGIARAFEDVGVTAYAGAVTALTSGNLTLAGQILGTESYHAGALRLISIEYPGIAAYVKADSLDVPPHDEGTAAAAAQGPTAAGGFFTTAGASTATAAFPAGTAFYRTASQVLSIVYGGASSGATSGGFFPNGVNGLVNTV